MAEDTILQNNPMHQKIIPQFQTVDLVRFGHIWDHERALGGTFRAS